MKRLFIVLLALAFSVTVYAFDKRIIGGDFIGGGGGGADWEIPLYTNITPSRDSGGELGSGEFARSSTAYYWDEDGVLQSAATDVQRFEYVGGYWATLIEPAGENKLLYCRDLSQASWTQTHDVATQNQTGVDGVSNKAWYLEDASGIWGRVYQSITIAADTNAHCVSVCIKKDVAGETPALFAKLLDATPATIDTMYIELNTDTGAMTSDNYPLDFGVEDRGDWWRLWMIVPNDGTGVTLKIEFYAAGLKNKTANSTGSCVVDWFQLELNQKFPTSPIYTEGSTVTRATESGYPRWNIPSGIFDATGTMVIRWRPSYNESDISTDSGIAGVTNTVASLLYHDVSGNGIASHDGTTEATKGLAFSSGTWYKLALEWPSSANKYQVGVDSGSGISWGAEVVFDGAFTEGSYLQLATSLLGPVYMRKVQLWKRILTDAEIDALE